MRHRRPVLGLDIGGVIIDGRRGKKDISFFGGKYLRVPPIEGAFESIAHLVDAFGGDVFLVSKADERTERRTREWLKARHFFERTDIDPGRLHFCRDPWDKKYICHDLGVTHFVDDKLEVLAYMEGVVAHRVLFNPRAHDLQNHIGRMTDDIRIVADWHDAEHALLRTL